jgi:tRNA(Ile2) C34 agmatinyltransferase TiaS
MTTLLLGIDDTDVLGHKPGTGRLARELGALLEERGLVRLIGVVRLQLLVDPRIPYTSHNSPACVVLEAQDGGTNRLLDVAAGYVTDHAAAGSDPGVCLAGRETVGAAVRHFGARASSEVLTQIEALELARSEGIALRPLGGTGDGVIGALAAVGLTADGNAGRFLEYRGGLRSFGPRVSARVLRERGITLVSVSRNGELVPLNAEIETDEWVRPRLLGGQPVLLVEPTAEGWRCFDRRSCSGESQDEGA